MAAEEPKAAAEAQEFPPPFPPLPPEVWLHADTKGKLEVPELRLLIHAKFTEAATIFAGVETENVTADMNDILQRKDAGGVIQLVVRGSTKEDVGRTVLDILRSSETHRSGSADQRPLLDDDEEFELAFPCPQTVNEVLGRNFGAKLKALLRNGHAEMTVKDMVIGSGESAQLVLICRGFIEALMKGLPWLCDVVQEETAKYAAAKKQAAAAAAAAKGAATRKVEAAASKVAEMQAPEKSTSSSSSVPGLAREGAAAAQRAPWLAPPKPWTAGQSRAEEDGDSQVAKRSRSRDRMTELKKELLRKRELLEKDKQKSKEKASRKEVKGRSGIQPDRQGRGASNEDAVAPARGNTPRPPVTWDGPGSHRPPGPPLPPARQVPTDPPAPPHPGYSPTGYPPAPAGPAGYPYPAQQFSSGFAPGYGQPQGQHSLYGERPPNGSWSQAHWRQTPPPANSSYHGGGIPDTFDKWLRSLDQGRGELLRYLDALEENFEAVADLSEVERGPNGEVPDPQFFKDLSVEKEEHKEIFRRWFRHRVKA